jgi:hypothetical protein
MVTIGTRIGVAIHHTAARLGLLPAAQRIAQRILERLTR